MTHRIKIRRSATQEAFSTSKGQPRKLHHPHPASTVAEEEEEEEPTSIPASAFLEQPTDGKILEVIHHALRSTLDSPGFPASVQKVKGLLYDKKWLEVFTDQGLLESYAGRWVPSRACCYRELFAHLGAVRKLFMVEQRGDEGEGSEDDDSEEGGGEEEPVEEAQPGSSTAGAAGTMENKQERLTTNILSLGGGASSELIAVASLVRACLSLEPNVTEDRKGKSPVKWNWTGIDIGKWDHVVDKFRQSLSAEWELDDDTLGIDFGQGDLLASPSSATPNPPGDDIPPLDLTTILQSTQPDLVTILFTLTELLTQSRPATFSLLHSLTRTVRSGTMLLVADSASDISEFEMGSSGRKWPIYMILDTILLGMPSSPTGEWEVVRKEDSRWYRLPVGVGGGWPVKLENTRYWYRLYRRL